LLQEYGTIDLLTFEPHESGPHIHNVLNYFLILS